MNTFASGACFSEDGRHRLVLWRSWCAGSLLANTTFVMFIGLNPSTANSTTDDPTIRKCVGFGQRWNFGGMYMLNLFTLVSTDPSVLINHTDSLHPETNSMLKRYATKSKTIVCAWGAFPVAVERAREVSAWLHPYRLSCLTINKDGSPKHPLYVPYHQNLIPYEVAA